MNVFPAKSPDPVNVSLWVRGILCRGAIIPGSTPLGTTEDEYPVSNTLICVVHMD